MGLGNSPEWELVYAPLALGVKHFLLKKCFAISSTTDVRIAAATDSIASLP
jgi:hypothetical protein